MVFYEQLPLWQVLLTGVICGFVAANLAGFWRYNRTHAMLWGWAGFFLGPIGLALLVLAQLVRLMKLNS